MNCLVVYCHPVPESFAAALRDASVETLKARGWDVRLIDLYAEKFDPVLSAEERHNMEHAPTDPKLMPHIESLRWAQAILFVYPTWWYGLPAMLKGWLDRVWWTDVAFELPPHGHIVSLLSHVDRVGVITTCGTSWWISMLVGQPGRKTILRGIRALCAWRTKTMFLALYDMDASTQEGRVAFLEKVKRKVARW